jgi:hypothetical protein
LTQLENYLDTSARVEGTEVTHNLL